METLSDAKFKQNYARHLQHLDATYRLRFERWPQESLLGLHLPPERLVTIYKGHDPSWYTASAPASIRARVPS